MTDLLAFLCLLVPVTYAVRRAIRWIERERRFDEWRSRGRHTNVLQFPKQHDAALRRGASHT